MKKLFLLIAIKGWALISIAQTLEISNQISNDPDTDLPRVVFWETNFENLKQGYYEVTFTRSLRTVLGKEKARDQFIYKTSDITDPKGRRCAFNPDGSWHVSHDENDPRWSESIPEFEFWFNLVNKIDKNLTDEAFKKTIITNLDESGYFN